MFQWPFVLTMRFLWAAFSNFPVSYLVLREIWRKWLFCNWKVDQEGAGSVADTAIIYKLNLTFLVSSSLALWPKKAVTKILFQN